MDNVVKLEKPSATKGKNTGRGQQQRRRRKSRTALVLGGGGFTGGVYEIGALRALDLLAVNKTVNQFDVYVGTSAGSFPKR
jgi:NTE family protein